MSPAAPLGVLGPTALWYLARATGAVSLVLLTGSVLLGILGPLRFQGARWPRFAVGALHRDISLLVLSLLAAHILVSVLDGFAPIGLLDGIVPFNSSYRPLWLGLGALAFDLLLALALTSLLRSRIGLRAWRGIHWLAYVSWPVAVLHGLGTGSDTRQAWMLLLTAACLAIVLAAVAARLRAAEVARSPGRPILAGVAAVVPAGMAVFAVLGPLAPGWARRAGTPPSLLGHRPVLAAARRPRAGAPVRRTVPAALSRPFTAQLSGTLRQSSAGGGQIVEMLLQVSGGLDGTLRLLLGGRPDGNGGISLTGSQVDLAVAGAPRVFSGRVVDLRGSQFVAAVAVAHARLALRLEGALQINGPTVTGQLQGAPAPGGGA